MSKGLLGITPNRWIADIDYEGVGVVSHYLDEICDLHSVVERGPNFYLINSIDIRLNPEREGYSACRSDAVDNSDIPNLSGLLK